MNHTDEAIARSHRPPGRWNTWPANYLAEPAAARKALIVEVAFDGVLGADIDTTVRVLRAATGRLASRLSERSES